VIERTTGNHGKGAGIPKSPDGYYKRTLQGLELLSSELGFKSPLEHRFVGGTLTDLLGPDTKADIDIKNRTVNLKNHLSPNLYRADSTVKDVDLICFCPPGNDIDNARSVLKVPSQESIDTGIPYPNVSIESVKKRRKDGLRFKQFVTTFEIDDKGELSLNFGKVHQSISWKSVEPWKVVLEDGTSFTILNPIAHALCYPLRLPSGVKKKDRVMKTAGILTNHVSDDDVREWEQKYNKMSLVMKLATQVRQEGFKKGIDYMQDLYKDWIEYINKLHKHPDMLTHVKAGITRFYWDTMGEAVSHGKGPFLIFSRLSDKFTG